MLIFLPMATITYAAAAEDARRRASDNNKEKTDRNEATLQTMLNCH